MQAYSEISIVGLGLLGGSLAAATRQQFPATRIVGISSPKTLEAAREAGLIDEGCGYGELENAIQNSELVVLCTPIDNILETFDRWKTATPTFRKPCIVTDVGSTKKNICELGNNALKNSENGFFLGAHPMAGSEKTGIGARDPLLFENAPWIICPGEGVPSQVESKYQDFIRKLGARPIVLGWDVHDKIVAHVSHLPQFLSTVLAGFILEQKNILQGALDISGRGLRDMTRLAESSYGVWKPIFGSNRKEVDAAIQSFREFLGDVYKSFGEDNLENQFEKSQGFRRKLLEKSRGFSTDLWEILVTIPDQTGILLDVLTPIVGRDINILDLEIIKVREGESGTLRLGFKSEAEAEAATDELKKLGFPAKLRL